jgi:hypothetical protein
MSKLHVARARVRACVYTQLPKLLIAKQPQYVQQKENYTLKVNTSR